MSLRGIEAKIVTDLLVFLAGRGWTPTSIADEADVVRVQSAGDVMREVGETALARVYFARLGRAPVRLERGWVLVIPGNDEDILSDWSDNALGKDIDAFLQSDTFRQAQP